MPMHLATVLFILFHMLPLCQFTGTAGGRLHYGKGTCHSGSGNKGATCTPTYICSDVHTSTWKNELENLGLQNIADAVRRFAGANVKDYGGIGGLKTVSVRSLGATHTAVAYDGVAVSNTQAGQIDIGRFALDDIDMLSLSVGQNHDLLQPARLFASAGILSIYSKNP